jgi:hypothetical protein
LFDRKLIFAAPIGGVVVGALAWLLLGRGGASVDSLAQSSQALADLRSLSARTSPPRANPAATAPPLFGRMAGEVEAPEASVVLQGVVRTARQRAALLSIAGKPADWLQLGQTREGFTLESVDASGVTLSSASGVRQVGFGAAQAVAPPLNDPPSGYRGPPEPASAPGTP